MFGGAAIAPTIDAWVTTNDVMPSTPPRFSKRYHSRCWLLKRHVERYCSHSSSLKRPSARALPPFLIGDPRGRHRLPARAPAPHAVQHDENAKRDKR